jgi:hypothetical protein
MQMIPPTYDPSITSLGERAFFEDLSASDLQGVCFHSLRLARHPDLPVSETDFVMVTPDGLLVAEVKSGGVTCDETGVWRYRGRKGIVEDNRGPVAQAESAQWALRSRLADLVGADVVAQVATGWAAVFPQCDFDEKSVEWEDWQVSDQRNRGPKRTADWVRRCQREWRTRLGKAQISASVSQQLARAMRPSFQVVPTLAARAGEVATSCARLTLEQLQRLEVIDHEDRLLITGGAGTGKTLLALETARQAAARDAHTVLMVPTKNLQLYLSRQPQMDRVRVVAAEERGAGIPQADFLIVDEGQDLLDFAALDMISGWIDGGLEQGRWRIFLDDNTQAALIGRFNADAYALLKAMAVATPRLTRNCRNTSQVVDHVQMLTGADLGIPTVAEGPGVTIEQVASPSAAASLLGAYLKRLRKDGVEDSDIVILSPDPDRSCVKLLKPGIAARVRRLDANVFRSDRREGIVLASPAEFKGLESSFVCVVDLHEFDDDVRTRDELYVAMTRARASLWMAVDEALNDAMSAAIRRNLEPKTERIP